MSETAYSPYVARESAADAIYAQLARALDRRKPECVGNDLFTADNLTAGDVETLAPICASCDMTLLCRQYAKAAKVSTGFRAGKNYGFGAGRGTRHQKAA